jgi:hypothetical protein
VPRAIWCFVLPICCTLPCWAEPAPASKAPATSETVVRLTVQPMAAPKPALRYLLLPELKEMNPGNPIQGYLRCFSEQQNFFFNKEACQRRDELLVMPLQALPTQELQDYGHMALRQADWAARLDKPDWQILLKVKTDGVTLLLPDVQQMRTLASALKVRFRGEVALHRFDDALGTAKTMFALARHLSEHPTLISDLVAVAIATITIGPLEEMLEQPGCPNLYWALTNLPNPLVSMEKGMEGERVLVISELRDLEDSAPMSAEQLKKFIAHVDWLRQIGQESKKRVQSTRAWLDARIKEEGSVNAARARLIESGLPEERVKQFPPDQAILLDERRDYEVRRDDLMKLFNLPQWQIEALSGGIGRSPDTETNLFNILVPALLKVRRAQGRLEQRIAMLRHVEALRLYAAEHEGRLPAMLAEVTVPLPDDPYSGKPFIYKLDGGTAHLRGTAPPGEEKNPGFNIHYQVTIQK